MTRPQILIEVSWETANMVGGIHTVLATKAAAMRAYYPEHSIAIGPDLWKDSPEPPSIRREEIFPGLGERARKRGLAVRQGRWTIPGEPACLLVDFSGLYAAKDEILARLWTDFGVDSLLGGWDYLEPVLFGIAAGQLIEILIAEQLPPSDHDGVIAQFHEWMVASGMLYLRRSCPEVGTVFTTHATVLGRSLSGDGGDLAAVLASPPDDMAALARSRGVLAKHSMESMAARHADCFTTVSQITADEARVLLGRAPELVLPNGLGDDYPPPVHAEPSARAAIRARLLRMAGVCLGREFDPARTVLAMSSGRLEFLNKGIDLAIDAAAKLCATPLPGDQELVLFLLYPSAHTGPNRELLAAARGLGAPSRNIAITHDLSDPERHPIARKLAEVDLCTGKGPVHAVYVPIYLDGRDALVPMHYFEMLPAFDLTVFPSFYEPWGYTPLESIGYGVPTITSDLAGFGRWAQTHGGWDETGVYVLPRSRLSYDEALDRLVAHIGTFLATSPDARSALAVKTLALARAANWSVFGEHYRAAHRHALARARERVRSAPFGVRPTGALATGTFAASAARAEAQVTPRLRHVTVVARLPPELVRLRELAYNLAWVWDDEAASLFRDLSPRAWRTGDKNPLRVLDTVGADQCRRAVEDSDYLSRLARVLARMDALVASAPAPRIAYFCAEFGLAGCLPMYAGGMGILAGDHVKSASDLGIPLVGVGLAYRHGYFRQRLDLSGNQIAEPVHNDFSILPMLPVADQHGARLKLTIGFPGRTIYIQAWRVNVGRVQVLLLDTDLPENAPADREITGALYGGGTEQRLQQEIVLGVVGLRLLRALGLPIAAYHMNEGHSAFLVLARAKQLVRDHQLKFDEALEYVRQTTLFTTHTPVPAGHDAFDEALMRPYFNHYQEDLHVSWGELIALGRWPGESGGKFSMTLLALAGAARVNAVSEIHGRVSRAMFKGLFPGMHATEIPVDAITNGVHTGSWLAPEVRTLLDLALGHGWDQSLAQGAVADLAGVSDRSLWDVHLVLKRRLLAEVARRLEARWSEARAPSWPLERALAPLTTDEALVVVFARRFAPYKRAGLLFEDVERLERLVAKGPRPIVFLFAGKAHPNDGGGLDLIRLVARMTEREALRGHVVLLENYDIALARLLVQGGDVWLNTPTRPLEASGTSGMKAAINGCLNLSVQDGWWAEGYATDNGWSIGGTYHPERVDLDNARDHARLFELLEREVVPAYGDRNAAGVPVAWVARMRRSIETSLARFSSARMAAEYAAKFYGPMGERAGPLAAQSYAQVARRVETRRRLARAFDDLRVLRVDAHGIDDDEVPLGVPIALEVELAHPGLAARDLLVEVVHGEPDDQGELPEPRAIELVAEPTDALDRTSFRAALAPTVSGPLAFGLRVVPRDADGGRARDTGLKRVLWI